MPIFIAKDYEGRAESIVLAACEELAQAYWQGKDIYAHSVTEFSEESLEDHPTGVLPLLTTIKKDIPDYGPDRREYLLVSK